MKRKVRRLIFKYFIYKVFEFLIADRNLILKNVNCSYIFALLKNVVTGFKILQFFKKKILSNAFIVFKGVGFQSVNIIIILKLFKVFDLLIKKILQILLTIVKYTNNHETKTLFVLPVNTVLGLYTYFLFL